jgi:hypothetical protein
MTIELEYERVEALIEEKKAPLDLIEWFKRMHPWQWEIFLWKCDTGRCSCDIVETISCYAVYWVKFGLFLKHCLTVAMMNCAYGSIPHFFFSIFFPYLYRTTLQLGEAFSCHQINADFQPRAHLFASSSLFCYKFAFLFFQTLLFVKTICNLSAYATEHIFTVPSPSTMP